ncbi:MAG: 30S ribosomal protein S1 [Deltaproteobacteria bacterium]|nr:30S ribosomal protein S1 [Deltaproteobacteria bacterium]
MEEEDKNIDVEAQPEESFADLLEQTIVAPIRLNPGDKVEAEVIKILSDWVFIDLGSKSEGCIALDEFVDQEGRIAIQEGDRIDAYFLSSRDNEMLFTTRISGGSMGSGLLEEAYHNRIPVEGFVEKEIKGGFEIKVGGSVRAFCPFSQMDLKRVEDSASYIGQHMVFRIIEYGADGRKIILSNRIILEEEREEQKNALRESLREGMTVSGKITSIRKFGAFIDIGGLEGLIPISEISWGRVEDISESIFVGQKVDVVVKKVDWENDRFSFSLRDILPDPWKNAAEKYPEGSMHKGRVSRLVPFGAFVTLEPGIDGLIHISELIKNKRINHPREILEENQFLEVRILKVDQQENRLSLTVSSEEPDKDECDDFRKHLSPGGKSSGAFGTLGDIFRKKMERK